MSRALLIVGTSFTTFMLSLAILISGIHMGMDGNTNWEHPIINALIIIGAVFAVVSLQGCVSLYYGNFYLWVRVYKVVIPVMLVLWFILIVFILAVTIPGSGRKLPDRGYKEYSLYDYSSWLRNKVNDTNNWYKIKRYLIKTNVCSHIHNIPNLTDFRTIRLSSVQSGCCKPADECNFEYISPIEWNKPAVSLLNSTNMDCTSWDNDEKTLCFDCNSCKAGFLDELKLELKHRVSINGTLLLFGILFIYCCSCFMLPTAEDTSKSMRQESEPPAVQLIKF